MKLPKYSDEDIKKIEKEFEDVEWKRAKNVFGCEAKFKSVFVFDVPERIKKPKRGREENNLFFLLL